MKAFDIQMARLAALTTRPVAAVKRPVVFELVTLDTDDFGVDLVAIEEGRVSERAL